MNSFRAAGWWNTALGIVVGAALVSLSSWAIGESKKAPETPIGEQWWPSEFGADDQRGATNRIPPKTVVQAAQLIKEGRIFQLGRLYEQGMPIPGKRHFNLTIPGLPTGLPTGKKIRSSRTTNWSAERSAKSGRSSMGWAMSACASAARTSSTTATSSPNLVIRTV